MKAKIDLHVHTVSSGHAYSTVKENVEEAEVKGLEVLGISDHAESMPGTATPLHFYNLSVLKKYINGVRVLRGIELNIVDFDGKVDCEEDLLKRLDYAIASLHPPCIAFGTLEENTRAILKAMENPYVKIIGHPDDNRYPLDYEEIVNRAYKTGTFLEINNSSLKPNSYREGARENASKMLKLCKEKGVMVVMGSDSHIYYDIGKFSNCESLLKETDFPDELVLNYREDALKLLGVEK